LAVCSWIKNVTDSFSLVRKTLSRWLELLVVLRVGKGNKEITSVVSIDVVCNPFLILRVTPNLVCFSCLVNLGGHLVNVGVGVHVLPRGLSIIWIITTGIVLLRPVVIEWNTPSSQSESKSRLESLIIVELILESSVVVVIYKNTKGINILEFAILFSKSILKVVHGLSRSKNILNREIHWIVKYCGEMVLIWTDIIWITVKDLSHLENTSCFSILTPEVWVNLWNSVNSNTVKAVSIY